MKTKVITLIIIAFSVVCGILLQDYFVGTAILISGLLNAYYASLGKVYNYFFGATFSLAQ
jgi:nicotinamide riboside transporter PnuC